MSKRSAQVVVAGGGPAGLLVTLRLARAGISVICLELSPGLVVTPKATHYAPPAVRELAKAGVLQECREKGYLPFDMAWRAVDGRVLASFSRSGAIKPKDNPDATVAIPQHILSRILYEHAIQLPNVRFEFDRAIHDLQQDDNGVEIKARSADGTEYTYTCEYAIGADGGKSVVRKLIGQSLKGFTWQYQVVATNIKFPFKKYNFNDANFMIDPVHWALIAKIEPEEDGVWRVSYAEEDGYTYEELRARLPAKFAALFPGPDPYEVCNFAPYRVHQRVVDKMVVGRVCLISDAAHLNNPYGEGLGLTTGIIDAGNLADCFEGVYKGLVDPTFILEKYNEVRRQIWIDYVNPVSTANIQRLPQTPEHALEQDAFIKGLATRDQEVLNAVMTGGWKIQHDFTQYQSPPIATV